MARSTASSNHRRSPRLATPPIRLFYMPNNDSDAIAGDPSRMAKIRTATKIFRPYFFDTGIPFVYAWPLGPDPADQQNVETICSLAERLYQLGRGIDMAWAWGETLDDGKLQYLLAAYPGQVLRPSEKGFGSVLQSACPGTLESLDRRYRAYAERFTYLKDGKKVKVVFRQPPKAQFQLAQYDSPPSRQMYELRDPVEEGVFAYWPLERAHALVVALRDAAVARLKRSMPARAAITARSSYATCHSFLTVRRCTRVWAGRSTALVFTSTRSRASRSSGTPGLRMRTDAETWTNSFAGMGFDGGRRESVQQLGISSGGTSSQVLRVKGHLKTRQLSASLHPRYPNIGLSLNLLRDHACRLHPSARVSNAETVWEHLKLRPLVTLLDAAQQNFHATAAQQVFRLLD